VPSASRSIEVASSFWFLEWHSLPNAVPISNHALTYHSLWAWSESIHVDYRLATSGLQLIDIRGVANEEVNNSSCFVLNSYRVRISLLRPAIMIDFWFSSVPPDKFKDGWCPPLFSSGPPGKFRCCNPTQNRAWSIPHSLSNLVLTMRDSRLSRRWCAAVHSGGHHKRFEGMCCLFLRGRKLRHSEKERWHRGKCKMKTGPISPPRLLSLAVFPLVWPIILPWRLRHQVLSKHLIDYTASHLTRQQSSLFLLSY
jgi:hypothetical protein